MNEEPEIREEDSVGPIPKFYHEGEVARLERMNLRLFWALILTILLLVGTNAGWVWYESQFEDINITAEQTADGASNNYAIGGDFIGSSAEGNNTPANP